MWATQAKVIIALILRTGMLLFALDILAWTFGLEILPPLDALLCLGIWLVPSLLAFFFPSFILHLSQPITALLTTPIKEITEVQE